MGTVLRGVVGLIAAIVAIDVAASAEVDPGRDVAAEVLADRVVKVLQSVDPSAAAALLHYPRSYTEAERATDLQQTRSGVRVLVEHFGTVSQAKLAPERLTFFEVGTGGGDGRYWQSLSPLTVRDFIYTVQFSKLGTGVVKIRTFRAPALDEPQVQSIGFGLRASRPGAKPQVISAMKAMMRDSGMPLPDNLDALLEESMTEQGADAP